MRPDSVEGLEVTEGTPVYGRRKYRYDIREFRIIDGGYHQCTGQVVAVLQKVYRKDKNAWYLTVLVRRDSVIPGLTPGEEVWSE